MEGLNLVQFQAAYAVENCYYLQMWALTATGMLSGWETVWKDNCYQRELMHKTRNFPTGEF